MMDQHELDMLTRLSRSLDNVQTYLAVVDRAEGLRQGNPHPAPSPLSRELSLARTLIAQLTYQGPGNTSASTGALIAHVTDTDGDPAHVRETMTDAQANALLWDSICRTGTPSDEAQAIADMFVPITDGTGHHADLAARRARRAHPSRGGATGPVRITAQLTPLQEEGTPTPRDIAERTRREGE